MDPVGRSQAGGSQAALIRVGDAGCGSRKGCSTDAACVTEEYEEEIKRSAQNQQGWNLRPVPAGLQLQDCALLQRATTVPWEKRGKKRGKKNRMCWPRRAENSLQSFQNRVCCCLSPHTQVMGRTGPGVSL